TEDALEVRRQSLATLPFMPLVERTRHQAPSWLPTLWPIAFLSQPQPQRSKLPGGAFTGGRNSSG
ncbi:MYO1C isoform 10, partial [Pan troglodytes]